MFRIDALISEIDALSGGRLPSTPLCGAQTMTVRTFAPLDHAAPDTVAFLAQAKYRDQAVASKAGVLVISQADSEAMYGQAGPERPVVITKNPYAWFAYALQIMTRRPMPAAGVRQGAHVDSTAKVAASAVIEAGATVAADAVIGERVHVYPGVYVGEGTVVGDDAILYANVTVYHGCRIGNRCILHSGCVIGADGFGFAPLDGQWVKIPQIGGVVLEDDVEVGANTTIDRGALDNTIVRRGSKLDNQIQLGHNCRVGEHSVMAACTGVAGSTHIGSHCIIGGAANINGHIEIPDGTSVGPATSLMSWSGQTKVMTGFFPAMPHREFERTAVLVMNLPKMRKQLKDLEARLEAISAEQTTRRP